MRGWLLALMLVLCGAAVGDVQAQQGEVRIALIIANESYSSGSFQPLPGTRRDAAVMRDALQRAGFRVVVRSNLGREAMRTALAVFARDLSATNGRGIGFLYYSGHGIGQRGDNFLIPVDARIQAPSDLPVQGIALGEQLEAIEYSGAKATIVVLDACRTTIGRGGRGLTQMSSRTDTLIAYSTQPNEIAADDGLYARTLAAEMLRPGADTVTTFARVTATVASATRRLQVPRYDNGLIEPVMFAPPAPPAVAAVAAPPVTTTALPPSVTTTTPPSAAAPAPQTASMNPPPVRPFGGYSSVRGQRVASALSPYAGGYRMRMGADLTPAVLESARRLIDERCGDVIAYLDQTFLGNNRGDATVFCASGVYQAQGTARLYLQYEDARGAYSRDQYVFAGSMRLYANFFQRPGGMVGSLRDNDSRDFRDALMAIRAAVTAR